MAKLKKEFITAIMTSIFDDDWDGTWSVYDKEAEKFFNNIPNKKFIENYIGKEFHDYYRTKYKIKKITPIQITIDSDDIINGDFFVQCQLYTTDMKRTDDPWDGYIDWYNFKINRIQLTKGNKQISICKNGKRYDGFK